MSGQAIALVLLSASFIAGASAPDGLGASERGNQKTPSNMYLWQKPPGLVPKLFAPGIVSTGLHEHSAVLITPGRTCFRADLMPALWLLTHRYQSRIFQDKTVLEIMADVLSRAGLSSD